MQIGQEGAGSLCWRSRKGNQGQHGVGTGSDSCAWRRGPASGSTSAEHLVSTRNVSWTPGLGLTPAAEGEAPSLRRDGLSSSITASASPQPSCQGRHRSHHSSYPKPSNPRSRLVPEGKIRAGLSRLLNLRFGGLKPLLPTVFWAPEVVLVLVPHLSGVGTHQTQRKL